MERNSLKITVSINFGLFHEQRFLRSRKMVAVEKFEFLPFWAFWVPKKAKSGGSKEISVWLYFKAEMTSKVLNWS